MKSKIPKYRFCYLLFALWILLAITPAFAKDITILFTGETHAMLYHCNCPKEPDGGVSRRAALIKEIRSKHPDAILVDSGSFFAGGLQDEYTLNTDLDQERTLVNLKAMGIMQYDAINLGDDEFNFGREFFEKAISENKLPLVSANIKADQVLPFMIKDVSGVKAGIIGLSGLSGSAKAGGIIFEEPLIALKEAVSELKKQKTDLIILLSRLGEEEDLKLIKEVAGIDVVVVGRSRKDEKIASQEGPTFLIRPAWQGRRLGKIILSFENGKIIKGEAEEIRLSDKIKDDAQILKILPVCFSDANCRKDSAAGICKNPGAGNAACEFPKFTAVPLTIIIAKDCFACDPEPMVKFLKAHFPGLEISLLNSNDNKAKRLLKDLKISSLPAYILGKAIEKEKSFLDLKGRLEKRGDHFIVREEFSGVSYFLNRKKQEGKIDLFISLYYKDAAALLENIRSYNPAVHFLAIKNKGGFEAVNGPPEAEEYLRSACVQKYYPQIFWDYIICRAKKISSSWWDKCAEGIDAAKIRNCAMGPEGAGLLEANSALNQELKVMFGPTYLMDNQQIFSSLGAPSKEELKKIFKQ